MSRYSQLYIDQSAPLSDSERARHRLGKQIESLVIHDGHAYELGQFLEGKLGIKVEAYNSFDLSRFLAKCAARDLLDAITLTFTQIGRASCRERV